jgi:hypothetical protein
MYSIAIQNEKSGAWRKYSGLPRCYSVLSATGSSSLWRWANISSGSLPAALRTDWRNLSKAKRLPENYAHGLAIR